MKSRVSKYTATALLFALVAAAPMALAVPARSEPPQDRVSRIIKRIRQFFTPVVEEAEWPTNPVPGKP